MNFKEVITGTAQEIDMLDAASRVRQRHPTKFTTAQAATLTNADQISRRIFLRRLGVAGAGVALAASVPAGILIKNGMESESDPALESKYLVYLRGFEEVVEGDPQASEYLEFFKSRRKQGQYQNGSVISLESGDSAQNFYTAVIPEENLKDVDHIPGFSIFRTSTEPTQLFLKDVPITQTWAGILLAHESVHVHQWLNGIEQEREDGFIEGEVDAYQLELGILNRLTQGQLNERFLEVASRFDLVDDEGNTGYMAGINPEDFDYIDSIFPKALGKEENVLRMGVYIIGANFAFIESDSGSHEEEFYRKMVFTDMLMKGEIAVGPEMNQPALA